MRFSAAGKLLVILPLLIGCDGDVKHQRVSWIKKDLGTVLVAPGGVKVQDVIEIPNAHESLSSDLVISGKSCSCVSARLLKSKLQPREPGLVEFQTHFDGDEGRNTIQITCTSSSRGRTIDVVNLQVSSTIVPRIEMLNWPRIVPFTKGRYSFDAVVVVRTLLSEDDSELLIAGPSTMSCTMSLHSQLVTLDYLERHFACRISVLGDATSVSRPPMQLTVRNGDHVLKPIIAFAPSAEYRVHPQRPFVRLSGGSTSEVRVVIESDDPFVVADVRGVDAVWKEMESSEFHIINLKVPPIEKRMRQITVQVALQKGAETVELPIKLLVMH